MILFFYSVIRCAPISPLFPYTTLFRSVDVDKTEAITKPVRDKAGLPYEVIKDLKGVRQLDRLDRENALVLVQSENGTLDRKSTRLNSSHEWISYAVFCLKKKNTTTLSH